MSTSLVRVLLADDFEPFRRFLRRILKGSPEIQILGETTDGLETVEKARVLQPDLILLDVGLPHLDGISAARRIRAVSPRSKILFVSLHASADIVQECLNAGGDGYLVKKDAKKELLLAITTVMNGQRFTGARFSGCDSAPII